MAKKTPAEYEAMIGGLMHRIDTLTDELGCAKYQWEEWQRRAEKAEAAIKNSGKPLRVITASSTVTGSR